MKPLGDIVNRTHYPLASFETMQSARQLAKINLYSNINSQKNYWHGAVREITYF